jgi:CubicO group peptidase (beta-lactamase class C family)
MRHGSPFRRGWLLAVAICLASGFAQAQTAAQIGAAVKTNVTPLVPKGESWGAEVMVHAGTRTYFYNYGYADFSAGTPMSRDEVDNLASVGKLFASLMLGTLVSEGEVSIDDPVDKYLPTLKSGHSIKKVTLGMLASHSSGLPDRPGKQSWHPSPNYTYADFLEFLRRWVAKPCPSSGKCTEGEPGRQYIYSDTGFVLLRLAVAAKMHTNFRAALNSVTQQLGMSSTTLNYPTDNPNVMQGYDENGKPVSLKTEKAAGVFDFPEAGQIYSSSADMALFAELALGQMPSQTLLQPGELESQQPIFRANSGLTLAMGWQIKSFEGVSVLDKNGGLPFTSTYVGIAPDNRLAVVILTNRGHLGGDVDAGRCILVELAGASPPDFCPPAAAG